MLNNKLTRHRAHLCTELNYPLYSGVDREGRASERESRRERTVPFLYGTETVNKRIIMAWRWVLIGHVFMNSGALINWEDVSYGGTCDKNVSSLMQVISCHYVTPSFVKIRLFINICTYNYLSQWFFRLRPYFRVTNT